MKNVECKMKNIEAVLRGMKARERNAGWRIDYFLLSKRLLPNLKSASIHQEIFGSDHCPVEIVMEF